MDSATSLARDVEKLIGEMVAPEAGAGATLAVAVVHRGTVLAEWYGGDTLPDTTLISWSMAKSVTHALLGILVHDGRLDPQSPAAVTAWADDTRSEITIQQLLNMRSGLLFNEDYVDAEASHCIEMLFGEGRADVAHYAASLPLEHAPGAQWNYASGTTNILCRVAGDIVGGGADGMRAFLRDRLFGPLQMESASPRFDDAGTFIGSSFLYATASDFAKFGELYRNGGRANGHQVLPESWVEHATVPTPVPPGGAAHGYGAHWWLWPEYGGFAAHGYEGQRVIVIPERELTVVRLGKTVEVDGPAMEHQLRRIIERVPVSASFS